ncbi:unnamed protein product, partial [Arctia plantaginis]
KNLKRDTLIIRTLPLEKEKEIRDGWLDNIDWVKVKGRPEDKYKVHKDDENKGLGDESSSDEDEPEDKFDLLQNYKEIIQHMKPKETIAKALQRLGASSKVSSVERWKRKKAEKSNPDKNESDGEEDKQKEVKWEFKWDQKDEDVSGPHSTQQMQKWSEEGTLKVVFGLEKHGEDSQFYTSNRIILNCTYKFVEIIINTKSYD